MCVQMICTIVFSHYNVTPSASRHHSVTAAPEEVRRCCRCAGLCASVTDSNTPSWELTADLLLGGISSTKSCDTVLPSHVTEADIYNWSSSVSSSSHQRLLTVHTCCHHRRLFMPVCCHGVRLDRACHMTCASRL